MKKIVKIVVMVAGALLILVLALPALLSTGVARRAILKRVNATLDGSSVEVGDWSLRWIRGIRVQGITYSDARQRLGATVESVNVSAGLLALIKPAKHLGTVTVVSPHLWCDTSRLTAEPPPGGRSGRHPPPESPTATPGKAAPQPATLPLDVIAKLTISDASLEVRQPGLPPTTLLLDATVECPSLKKAITYALQARSQITGEAGRAGAPPDLTLDGSVILLHNGVFDPAAIAAQLALRATHLDLSALAAARALTPAMPAVTGTLESDLSVNVNGRDDVQLAGSLSLHQLRLAGGALGGDRPQIDRVSLDIDLHRAGGAVKIKQLSLESPLASLRVDGELTPVVGAAYPQGKLTVLGDVDLTALAAQLPTTLHLKPGMRVERGTVHVDATILGDAAGLRVTGEAAVRDLQGSHGGAAYALSAPITLALNGVQSAAGPVLDNLDLRAGFATAHGSGSATGAIVQLDVDLAAALKEAAQFVDLGKLQLGGTLAASLSADLQAADARRLKLAATLTGLSVTGLGARPDVAGDVDVRAAVTVGTNRQVAVQATLQSDRLQLRGGPLGTDTPSLAPLRLDADLQATGPRLHVRSLKLTSPLAQLDADGIVERVPGAALPRMDLKNELTMNISAVAAALPKTLKLPSGLHISTGTLQADVSLHTDADTLGWDATATLAGLAATRGTQDLRLSAPITVQSRGTRTGAELTLDTASLSAGFAQLAIKGTLADADLTAQADFAKAMLELGQFVDFGNLRFSGQLTATAGLHSPSATERDFTVDARIDKLELSGLTPEPIRREQVHITKRGTLLLDAEGKPTGLRALTVALDGLPLAIKASVAALALPSRDTQTPASVTDAAVTATGAMTDVLAFCHAVGLLKQDLPMAGPLNIDAKLSGSSSGYRLDHLALTTAPLAIKASGKLDDAAGTRHLNLAGSLSSDCTELARLTEALSGYRPDMSGRATRDFSIEALLGAGDRLAILRRTRMHASLHADTFRTFGLSATNLDLAVHVQDGLARVVFDTVVNNGRAHAEPYLDMNGPGLVLAMPTNSQVLTHVTLNRDMASELLARIHPIFHGCAVIGGDVSMRLDNLHAPLGPRLRQDTTFAGTMVLTDIRLGPGDGMLAGLLRLLKLSSQDTLVSNQVVTFTCRDGRITPSPVAITVDRKTITFSGSVGLDQSLQYSAEMPVTARLLHRDSLPPALKNQVIKVPIDGTVTKPSFDERGFARSLAEFGLKAAGNMLLDSVIKRGTAPADGEPAETPTGGGSAESDNKQPAQRLLKDLLKQRL